MRIQIIIILFIWSIITSPASAGFNISLQDGFPVSTEEKNVITTPYLQNITGDAAHEVIVSAGGSVYVYSSSGSLVWKRDVSSWSLHSSPAAGDITGDNAADVVVGGGWGITNDLNAWTGSGTSLTGFPKSLADDVWSSPTLTDIDGDAVLEIIVGCDDGNVYAFNGDGTNVAGWSAVAGGAVRTKPAVGDIDGDLDIEIIAAAKDGYVYAWHTDGTTISGFPKSVGSYEIDEGSVTLGDLDGDGILDVVVPSISGASGKIFAWGMSDNIPGWPVETSGIRYSTPSIGDVDGDGTNEVVVGSSFGDVYVFEHDGTLKWHDSVGEVRSRPLLVDLNNNDKELIIITSTDGYIHIWYGNGGKITALRSGDYIQGSPAAADIDDDGVLEVAAIARNGDLYVWNIGFRAIAPNVSITSPADGAIFGTGEVISFESDSTDTDGTIVSQRWHSDRDDEISTEASFSRVLSDGLHVITLTCEDNDGITKSAQVQIKVGPETAIPVTNGGGSGGGGGAGATGEDFENIASTEVAKKYVTSDTRISYRFDGTITEVDFLSKKTAGEIAVVVESLYHTSELVDSFPEGVMYMNVNVWVGLAGYATEQNIGDAHVRFKVDKDWILSHDIDRNSIQLHRYHENTWDPLSTQMTGEDMDRIYFSARTPGFSPFVITGEKAGVTITKEMLEIPVEETEPEIEESEQKGPSRPQPAQTPSIPSFEYPDAVMILFASCIMINMGRRYRE